MKRYRIPSLFALSLVLLPTAGAVDYTYNPAAGVGDLWSSGAGWDVTPASGIDNTLTFNPLEGTFVGPITNTNTNDFVDPFKLNALTLAGTGSVDATVVNIVGGTLEFNTSGASVAPVINLNATNAAAPGTVAYNVGSALSLAATTTITGTGNAAFNFTGPISGAGGLTKLGTSTVTLSGAASYAGPTTVTAGTLALGASNAIGAGALTVDGGTLALGANSSSVASVILSGGSITGAGTLTSAATFDVRNGTASAVLAGAVGLTKSTAGTVTLSGNNTYTGVTTISNGILNISAAANLGDASETNTISLSGGGTLVSTANTYSLGVNRVITLSGAGTIQTNAGALTVNGDVNLGANVLTVQGGAATTISGVIAGSGGLSKLGTGALTLSNTNTYSGITSIGAGAVNITAAANLGDGSVTNTISLGGGTLAATGTFALGANRDITLTANSTLQINAASVVTVDGDISGAFGLTKTGAGELVLSGGNTYSGVTALNAGVTRITSAGNLGDGSATNGVTFNGGTLATTGTFSLGADRGVTFTGAGTFRVESGTLTVDGTKSGGGAISKTGAGTLLLTGASTATGTVALTDGILQLDGGNNRLSTGALTLGAGTTSGKLVLGGTTAVTQTIGTLNISGTGTSNTIVGGNEAVSTLTLNGGGGSAFAGVIGGTGTNENNIAIVKSGGGTFVLNGVNSHTGGTTVNQGTLAINSAAAIGSGTLTLSGGTLRADGALTLTNPISITAGTTIGGTTQSINISSPITSTVAANANALTISNTGVTTISTASTFTGRITINNGATLALGSNTASGSGLNPQGGSTITSADATPRTVTLTGIASGAANIITFGKPDIGGTGDLTLTFPTFGTAALVWTTNVKTIMANNPDTGAGASLTKNGPGSLVFNGSGTFTVTGGANAGVKINEGAIEVGTGGTTGTFAINGANAKLDGEAGTFIVFNRSNALTFTAPPMGITGGIGIKQIGAGTTTLAGGANSTYSGPILLQAGALSVSNGAVLGNGSVTNTLTFNGGALISTAGTAFDIGAARETVLTQTGSITVGTGAMTISGLVSGAGGLTKLGTGTLILAGTSNTYSGVNTVNSGVLQFAASGSLGDGSATNAISLGGGTLALGNADTVTLGSNRAITLTANSTIQVATGGVLTANGAISGAGGLTKTGNGELNITQATTYEGPTNVNGGVLTLSAGASLGAGPTFSAVTVSNAGATLAGGSLVSPAEVGAITINGGGTLAPGIGSALGQINAHGLLSFANNSTLSIDISSGGIPSSDSVTGVIGLNLAGTVNLNFTDSESASITLGTVIKLISYTGEWNGGFFTVGGNVITDYDALTLPDSANFQVGANSYQIDYNHTDGGGTSVALLAVPEPGAVAMMVGGLGLLLGLRRRRR